MSLSLKHIPCPAGANCTAYMCLFGGHPTDESGPSSLETASKTPRMQKEDAGTSINDTARNPSMSKPPLNAAQPTPSTQSKAPNPPTSSRATSSKPTSAQERPNSTPAKKQPSEAAPSASKLGKPEPLNPRLLKHSPASHEIRLKLVRMLHQEYKRLNDAIKKSTKPEQRALASTDQQLITRVLDEEEAIAVGKAAVYTNIMKNNIMRHKRMQVADWAKERENEHSMNGRKRRLAEMEDTPVVIETGLTPVQEVRLLQRILTPIDELANHGYVSSIPTDEAVAKAKEGLDAADGWEQCDRCRTRFQVFAGRRAEDGALTSRGECNFHWGKAYFPERQPGASRERGAEKPQKRLLCCGQPAGDSPGCHTHPNHVFKVTDPKRLATVLNFARTPDNDTAPGDRAVCFDCEMAFTVHGMELVRLTATSWPDGAEILDVLVRPFGEILDLNSRYSGVWPDDLARAEEWRPGDALVPAAPDQDGEEGKPPSGAGQEAKDSQPAKRRLKVVPSPAAARDLLFSLIAPSTPLIGHGLENDLNAVRVVHPTLVDTVLAFPHSAGLPFRHSLKALMSARLNRKIQVQAGPKALGHDSAEDARAAGMLARHRLAEEWAGMKRDGWKVVDGQVVAPEANKSSSDGGGGGDDGAGSSGKESVGALTEAFLESMEE